MSVEITVVEFEKREAHLSSELEDGPPYTVHGIALGDGDITRGASGIKKYWPAEELKKAAESLEGKNLVEDHDNDSRGVIGEVTKAGYKESVGVLYEAELFDDDLAERIENGLLEVSIRGYHNDVDEMEETDDGAKIVEDIQFDNLSIVPSGASKSNTLEMGASEELSVAALSEYVGELQDEEIEAGSYVEWDDNRGIVLTMPEDGEVEVDLYEEDDDTFRPVGETEMVAVDSLDVWDVDEENIGPMEDEEEEGDDEDENDEDVEVDQEHIFASEEDAVDMAEEMDIEGAHQMEIDGEDVWVPGSSHDEYVDAVSEQSKHMDDDEAETAKHYHRTTFDKLEDFMTADENDETTAVNSFAEWADDDAVQKAVEEFSSIDGYSADSNIRDFQTWIKAVLNVPEDTDSEEAGTQSRAEGEEEILDAQSTRQEQSGDEHEEAEDSADEGSEESDVEELQEWEFHEASWDGTTESDWSSPDMEDFDTDDLGEVASHFLISQTGFPPENFTDLALPVVEPNGNLNVNALSAVKGGRGVSAVEGLSDDMEEQIVDYVNNLANEHFDKSWGEEEAASTTRDVPVDDAGPTHKMDPEVEDDEETEMGDPVGCALDLINIFLRVNGRDERDSLDKMLGWLFSSTDIPTKKIELFRTAANAFLDQQGGANSFDAVTVESFRDWLLVQGGQTNDGTTARSKKRDESPRIATPVHVLTDYDKQDDLSTTEVLSTMTNIEEQLEELDEPVAVEKDELENLQEKADRMDEMSDTLSDLKERTDVLDSVDSEKVEELADSEDPIVLESDEYEELTAEAEQVKQVYAETLSDDDSPFTAEELTDKFSIEELREKYEEAGHELEEELEAEPKSGDVDEEELEERAEEEEESEEELEKNEEIEAKQAELREKITGGE